MVDLSEHSLTTETPRALRLHREGRYSYRFPFERLEDNLIRMAEEIKQSDALTEAETQCLFGWGENIFGALPHTLKWRPKETHFVLYADGKPLSHVGLLRRTVKVNSEPINVAGVGGVVTVPEAQRRGLAQRVMKHAQDYTERDWAVDAGLLFCLPQKERYYGRMGWQILEAPVTIQQPDESTGVRKILSPLTVMILPLRNTRWPSGPVDLESLPW